MSPLLGSGSYRWSPLREHFYRYLALPQKKRVLLNPRWWPLLLAGRRLPSRVKHYLRLDNPRLEALSARYAAECPFEHSFWGAKRVDLLNFRGEWNYLAQLAYSATQRKYLVTAAYVAALDEERLLEELSDDALFGAVTIDVDGLAISRDLLDSILEICFLRRHFGLRPDREYTFLDIGAGYGRLAHRFTAVFPKSRVYCTDGVAVSTFLCEFYSQFRGFSERAEVVPLYEVERLSDVSFDFATNIHSWSECSLSGVRYWLELLADLKVPYLFVVPNWLDDERMFSTIEPNGERLSFLPELERHGYRLKVRERKFGQSRVMAKYGMFDAAYLLFEKVY